MTTQQIQKLLDKYFEGQSTLAEEADLKAYFQSGQVAESFSMYADFFQFLEQEKTPTLRADFESDLIHQLKNQDAPAKTAKIRQLSVTLLRIAAMLVLLVSLYFLMPKQEAPLTADEFDWSSAEPDSEEEAFEQTKAALQLLASKLNGSAKTASSQLHKVEKLNDIFK